MVDRNLQNYKDGEIKNYTNKISIQAKDIENAREIASLLTIITEKN